MTRGAALAALAWWRDAGVDVLVADEPRDWLAPLPSPLGEGRLERSESGGGPTVKSVPAHPQPLPRGEGEQKVADLTPIARADSLDALRLAVEAIRPRAIFSDGDPASGVMIVGETAAPDDDRTGRPFSGPAGELLDRMLAAIQLDRSSTYITNLLLWRSFGKASPADLATATAILRRHIELARPRALLVMGGVPAAALFPGNPSISALRGSWRDLTVGDVTVPALPTYNPAYLLRNTAMKKQAWADLQSFRAHLDA